MSQTGIITHILELDLYTTTSYPVVKAQQYDDQTRFLRVILKDHEEAYTLPSGATVKLFGTRPLGKQNNPSGREFLINGTVESTDTVLFDLTQAIDRDGIAVAKVLINYTANEADHQLTSIPIYFDVSEAAASGASIAEPEKDILDSLMEELDAHIADNVAHLSAAEHIRFTALRNIVYAADEPSNQEENDAWLKEYT